MIDPSDIQELKVKEPFEPFRIHLSDGRHFDATDPDLFVPMETSMFIAFRGVGWKLLSYQNMTSIEVPVPIRRGKAR